MRPVDRIFPEAERQAAIMEKRCVNPPFGCGRPVREFRDKLSANEFWISGLCQSCQDEIFGV